MIGIVFEILSTLPLDGSFLGSAYIVSSEPVKTGLQWTLTLWNH